jgi:hypothetical protein
VRAELWRIGIAEELNAIYNAATVAEYSSYSGRALKKKRPTGHVIPMQRNRKSKAERCQSPAPR